MARRTPPRWSLGASALAAVAIAGCGASAGDQSANSAALHAKDEQRLLSLIQSARDDASTEDGVGVDSDLSRFIATVNQLRGSGELTAKTAATLDRKALATEAQASRQLQHTTTTLNVSKAATSQASPTPTTTAAPATTTPAPTKPTPPAPKPKPKPAKAHGVSKPHHSWWSDQGNQRDQGPGPADGGPRPGHGHGHAPGHVKHEDTGWGASSGARGGGYVSYSGWDSDGPGSWSGGDRS